MNTASQLAKTLAPSGVLRVSINYGNPVLAYRDEKTGAPAGISVDIAQELASRLVLKTEFLTFDAARKSVEALQLILNRSALWRLLLKLILSLLFVCPANVRF